MTLQLGCIADDHTGATDLGVMLSRAGLNVTLVFGVPAEPIDASQCDAIIVALKSRSIPADEAIRESLAALSSLREVGAKRFFFKYCSTFDSTDRGNIGPVAEALGQALDAPRIVFCPAFPENGRTVVNGHLFVHGKPLNESGMEKHPLNPMTDANLVRVLGRQAEAIVGLLAYNDIDRGVEATHSRLEQLADSGVRLVIADALKADHLRTIASAAVEDRLVTGGSAVAQYLVREKDAADQCRPFEVPSGKSVVIAGSCSEATRRQVARMQTWAPSVCVDPIAVAAGEQTVDDVLAWANQQADEQPVLVYSTSDPDCVEAAHEELGREEACRLIESTLAGVAKGLVEQGVRRLVVAGGETSGAITQALGVSSVRIGREIAPGVPWVTTIGEPRLALALKSGNFGSADFFREALDKLG